MDRYEKANAFVADNVIPFAGQWDREQRIPESVLSRMAELGHFGCILPRDYGGQGLDAVAFGALHEAVGRGSSALAGVLTVQAMVCAALLKWGTAEQRSEWIPPLAQGRMFAAFALTEPGAGSALQSLATTFVEKPRAGTLILNGTKKWISCAQFASVFLVFGALNERWVACLVPRDTAGVHVEPIVDLMGFRAAGLAQVGFRDVEVPLRNVVGKPGFALSHVAMTGLHFGRISTACSASGLARGCFEEAVAHAAVRMIGDVRAGDLAMVRSLIAAMGADLEAAGSLCFNACRAEDEHLPEAYERALIAKYFASRSAVSAASNAVQICGAAGCHGSSPVSRFYRDAKIMEIIEGTTQVHESILGKLFVERAGTPVRPANG
jgi:alkylation response protein AidB-like acyl-CoA dehydrogenase